VYTRDVIDEANTIPDPTGATQANIYKTFTTSMDTLTTGPTSIINKWKAIPYDWRLDYPDLLASGKKSGANISYLEATTTPLIIQELRQLAATSQTGKVTIITHSNGGQLAKYLLNKLEEDNDPLLQKIDKLIIVAAPQVGTPKTVAGMLHGTGLDLPEDVGFLFDRSTARQLAENMPSAYNMLPSPAYFTTVAEPVVSFSEATPLTNIFRAAYGNTITTKVELHDFLLGAEGRVRPTTQNTLAPYVLNPNLLPTAEIRHTEIDSWTPPPSLQVIQIAGWGLDTLSGITYGAIDPCTIITDQPSCPILAPSVNLTVDGDSTVVVPSAVFMSTLLPNVERWWVNISKYNDQNTFNRNHADIFEVTNLLQFIKNIILGNRSVDASGVVVPTQPLTSSASKRLRFTLHSPATLHLFDSIGNHTGLISNPEPTSNLRLYEAELPNSYYREFGENTHLGVSVATTTTVQLEGLALGLFTLDIAVLEGNVVVASTTFQNIPVATSTRGKLVIPTGGFIPSNIPTLSLDIDGDGTTDTIIQGGEAGITEQQLVAILKGIVKTLDMPAKKKVSLLKKIEQLEKELAKEHKGKKVERFKTKQVFKKVLETIERYEKKRILTTAEAVELRSVIEQIKSVVLNL
jgi:pimeloyl-ACP methyl ester carboxylesterase